MLAHGRVRANAQPRAPEAPVQASAPGHYLVNPALAPVQSPESGPENLEPGPASNLVPELAVRAPALDDLAGQALGAVPLRVHSGRPATTLAE